MFCIKLWIISICLVNIFSAVPSQKEGFRFYVFSRDCEYVYIPTRTEVLIGNEHIFEPDEEDGKVFGTPLGCLMTSGNNFDNLLHDKESEKFINLKNVVEQFEKDHGITILLVGSIGMDDPTNPHFNEMLNHVIHQSLGRAAKSTDDIFFYGVGKFQQQANGFFTQLNSYLGRNSNETPKYKDENGNAYKFNPDNKFEIFKNFL